MAGGAGQSPDSPAPLRRARRAPMAVVAVFVALLALAGCKTDVYTRIEIASDGSGEIVIDVYLDAQADAQVGDLSRILAVDDLEQGGWTIIGPASPTEVARKRKSGSAAGAFPKGTVQVHLTHSFANVDEANVILANLNGPDGPYRNVRIDRSSSLFATELRVRGSVDLAKGLDAFSDPALVQALGAPLSEVVARSGAGTPTGDALTVTLGVEPRDGQSWKGDKGTAGITPDLVGASASLGGRAQSIDVTNTRTHWGVIVAMAAAGVVAVAILGLLVTAPRRRRTRYVGRHTRR